jgi:hypothetical protein
MGGDSFLRFCPADQDKHSVYRDALGLILMHEAAHVKIRPVSITGQADYWPVIAGFFGRLE